jgi:recombinational DNA repair ATPase RecF
MNPLRLLRLEIQNFRCFEHFELELDGASLTFVAANGGGKSPPTTKSCLARTNPV